MANHEAHPCNTPEYSLVDAHLSLGEIGVREVTKFAKEVYADLYQGLSDGAEFATFHKDVELSEKMDNLAQRLLETEVFTVGDSWIDFDSWNIPITSGSVELDDSFWINMIDRKNKKMLCVAFGPEVEEPGREFEYRIDFMADYSVPEQDLRVYRSEDANAEAPSELLKEFLGESIIFEQ